MSDKNKPMLRATYVVKGSLPFCIDKLDPEVKKEVDEYKYRGLCSNGKDLYETNYVFFKIVDSFEDDVEKIIETDKFVFGL